MTRTTQLHRTRLARPLVAAIAIAACTVDQGNSDPFGSGTAPVTVTLSTTTIPDPETSSEGTTSSGEGSPSDDTTTSGASDPTDATTSGVDASDTTAATTDDGGGGNGMQPADGMYSPCLTPEECGFVPILCITIGDADAPTDGFCSEIACVTPAVDCAATPGGTAIPRCIPVTVNDMADQACALDCSAGKTCPVPMQCYDLDGIGEICG